MKWLVLYSASSISGMIHSSGKGGNATRSVDAMFTFSATAIEPKYVMFATLDSAATPIGTSFFAKHVGCLTLSLVATDLHAGQPYELAMQGGTRAGEVGAGREHHTAGVQGPRAHAGVGGATQGDGQAGTGRQGGKREDASSK